MNFQRNCMKLLMLSMFVIFNAFSQDKQNITNSNSAKDSKRYSSAKTTSPTGQAGGECDGLSKLDCYKKVCKKQTENRKYIPALLKNPINPGPDYYGKLTNADITDLSTDMIKAGRLNFLAQVAAAIDSKKLLDGNSCYLFHVNTSSENFKKFTYITLHSYKTFASGKANEIDYDALAVFAKKIEPFSTTRLFMGIADAEMQSLAKFNKDILTPNKALIGDVVKTEGKTDKYKKEGTKNYISSPEMNLYIAFTRAEKLKKAFGDSPKNVEPTLNTSAMNSCNKEISFYSDNNDPESGETSADNEARKLAARRIARAQINVTANSTYEAKVTAALESQLEIPYCANCGASQYMPSFFQTFSLLFFNHFKEKMEATDEATYKTKVAEYLKGKVDTACETKLGLSLKTYFETAQLWNKTENERVVLWDGPRRNDGSRCEAPVFPKALLCLQDKELLLNLMKAYKDRVEGSNNKVSWGSQYVFTSPLIHFIKHGITNDYWSVDATNKLIQGVRSYFGTETELTNPKKDEANMVFAKNLVQKGSLASLMLGLHYTFNADLSSLTDLSQLNTIVLSYVGQMTPHQIPTSATQYWWNFPTMDLMACGTGTDPKKDQKASTKKTTTFTLWNYHLDEDKPAEKVSDTDFDKALKKALPEAYKNKTYQELINLINKSNCTGKNIKIGTDNEDTDYGN